MAIVVAWYKTQVYFSYITARQSKMGENNQEYVGSAESLEVDAITLKPGGHHFFTIPPKRKLA